MLCRTRLNRFVEPIDFKEIMFLNPTFKPLMSPEYGLPAKGFFVSSIQSSNGKLWQLRTITFRQTYFVVPFIINGGGICATQPILGSPMVKRIGADHSNPCKDLIVDSPIGNLCTFSSWDNDRNEDVKRADDGVLYNLIGHGLADLLQKIDVLAGQVLDGEQSVDSIVLRLQKSSAADVRALVKKHEALVRRELIATVQAKRLEAKELSDVALHDYAGRAQWLLQKAA